jgi:hypothetical protein
MKNIAYTKTWRGSVMNMPKLGVDNSHAIPSIGFPF